MSINTIKPLNGLEKLVYPEQAKDMIFGDVTPSNLVHVHGLYKHASLKKLVRFGVHRSIPFFVAATNEGYFIGGIGLTKENYIVANKINNEPSIFITFDLDICPVELYDRLNNIPNIVRWVGTDNNHHSYIPSIDIIDKYFPDNCHMGLYAKLIYEKQRRENSPISYADYTPDESETEQMLYRFIDNINKAKHMEVSNE